MPIMKRPLTSADKESITKMFMEGKEAVPIAKSLQVDTRQVTGFIRSCINLGKLGPRGVPPRTQEDCLKELAKEWRNSEPDAEFSLHTAKGLKVYIGAFKRGVVLRIGEQGKVALLTPTMAQRFGQKLSEMSNWSRFQ